jgi:hypothetical protein
MSKLLKYLYSISFTLIIFSANSQIDSVKKTNKKLILGFDYGVSVYNNIALNKAKKNAYNVDSKTKDCFGLSLTYVKKKFNYGLGFNYYKSEFIGYDFGLGAGVIPYKQSTYPYYYYYLYQKVNYNVLYGNLSFGYNFNLNKKSSLSANLLILFPILYNIKIDNYYAKTQTDDTTLFKLTRNAKDKINNFGYFPHVGISLSYNYSINKKFAFFFNTSFYYHVNLYPEKGDSYYDKYTNHTIFDSNSNYSPLIYTINNQKIFSVALGLKYSLFKN